MYKMAFAFIVVMILVGTIGYFYGVTQPKQQNDTANGEQTTEQTTLGKVAGDNTVEYFSGGYAVVEFDTRIDRSIVVEVLKQMAEQGYESYQEVWRQVGSYSGQSILVFKKMNMTNIP